MQLGASEALYCYWVKSIISD